MVTYGNNAKNLVLRLVALLMLGGAACDDGDAICTADSKTCGSESVVMVCDIKGQSWGIYQNCALGTLCRGGQCLRPPATCKNGTCDKQKGEQCNNCPEDCGKCCGDGVCQPQYAEDFHTCYDDCGPKSDVGAVTPDTGGGKPDVGGGKPDSVSFDGRRR